MNNMDNIMCYLTWLEHNCHLLLLDSWYKNHCVLTVWELGQCNRVIIRLCSVISWLGLGKDRSQKAEVHMEVVFFCPSSGRPLAETKWVALSVQSPFTHTVTLSLNATHTLRHKRNPISDVRKNRLFLCQPLSSCSTASGRCLKAHP